MNYNDLGGEIGSGREGGLVLQFILVRPGGRVWVIRPGGRGKIDKIITGWEGGFTVTLKFLP